MKNQLIDTPFENDIFIDTGETILWEGSPQQSTSVLDFGFNLHFFSAWIKRFLYVVWYFLGALVAHMIFNFETVGITVLWAIGILLVILPEYLIYKRKTSTKYILTTKKLIFQLWWFGKKTTCSVPISEIKNVTMSRGETFSKNVGTIFLSVRNAHLLTFDTYDFIYNERRHQPTLEMVDDVAQVTHLIKQTILNNPTINEKRNTR